MRGKSRLLNNDTHEIGLGQGNKIDDLIREERGCRQKAEGGVDAWPAKALTELQ
jgi:hypothetical protein